MCKSWESYVSKDRLNRCKKDGDVSSENGMCR